jgi:signal transduction histidine kinase
VLFLLLAFAGYTGYNVQYLFNSFYYTTFSFYNIECIGLDFPIFVPSYFFYLVYAFYKLYHIYRESEGLDKTSIGWFLLGEFTGYIGGGTFYFLPLIGIMWYPYWNFTVPLYVIVATYAIFKHKMLDINVIIKKTLVFTGLLVAVLFILIIPALLIQEYIVRGSGVGGRLLGLTMSGIIIIFAIRRIESLLINITDKFLFQKKYDYKNLLKTFTDEVLTVVDMEGLCELTVNKLADIMKISSSAVLLLDPASRIYTMRSSLNAPDSSFAISKGALNSLLSANPKAHILRECGFELMIPISSQGEIVGILALGKKKSDEDYTPDDLDILLPLSRTLAIAVSNAELFEELTRTQAEVAQKEKMATIGTLAAGMAHEIRNPITTIRTFADYLPEKYEDRSFMGKFARLIPKEIDKIDNITRSLLEFSYQGASEKERVDLTAALRLALSLLEPQYRFSEIGVSVDAKGTAIVTANRAQVQDAFFGILKYVVAEAPGGSTILIDIDGRIDGVMRISNERMAISDEVIKDVFEPGSKLSRERRGFGFDLFIAKEMLEKNGLKMEIVAGAGRGAAITIRS